MLVRRYYDKPVIKCDDWFFGPDGDYVNNPTIRMQMVILRWLIRNLHSASVFSEKWHVPPNHQPDNSHKNESTLPFPHFRNAVETNGF